MFYSEPVILKDAPLSILRFILEPPGRCSASQLFCPKPETLKPKPATLNPKPQTLNPKP